MIANHAAMMLVGLALEAVLGWPAILYARIGHPVSWLGRLISAGDRRWNDERASPAMRRTQGVVLALRIIALAGAVGGVLAFVLPGGWVGIVIGGVLTWPLLAARSLHDHVAAVAEPLGTARPEAARRAVAMIVGRNTDVLDETGIARAAAETLAENTSDGVIAPLFWGVLLGLPGIAAYKAINTLDSMIGYRTPRHLAFGWASARIDDVANLIPARLSGLLYALVSFHLLRSLRVMLADARHHRSPNAGWPEAAFAGALDIRLSGPRLYAEGPSKDAWLNARGHDPVAADLVRGLALFRRVVALTALILLALSVRWA